MNRVPAGGPSIMGIDLLTIATLLAAVAAFAVLLAIYAATTVRDPMARRVKALNERREQLKAGIVASTSKRRKSITNQNEVADKVRGILSSLKVLQERRSSRRRRSCSRPASGPRITPSSSSSPAGAAGRVRADRVIGVYGLGWLESWTPLKRYGVVAGTLLLAYKAPDIWLKNTITKRSHAIRKGCPTRSTCW
jgi:tight adherence protein C